MDNKRVTTMSGAKCPNHGCPLEIDQFPVPSKGVGICMISRWPFEYEIDLEGGEETIVMDKNGNPTKVTKYKITGDDE